MDNKVPIYFYIPAHNWPANLPSAMANFWSWVSDPGITYRQFELYSWIIQTCLHLKESGLFCKLVNNIPNEGIIVGHRFTFGDSLVPGPGQLLVCILGDKRQPGDPGPHPFAQIHLVQNPLETSIVDSSYYVPHWPLPGLLPRDIKRGDVFENIAYYGQVCKNCVLRDESLLKELKRRGFHLIICEKEERSRYNDFRDIDVVLAVRDLSRDDWTWKPATKLYNAWLGGVPAILGPESAYRAERRSDFDFIEVHSKDEIIEALVRLRDDKKLRKRMVENGRVRAREFTPAKITSRWRTFFTKYAIPRYHQWFGSVLRRNIFIGTRKIVYQTHIMQMHLIKTLQKLRIRVGLRTRIRKLFTRLLVKMGKER